MTNLNLYEQSSLELWDQPSVADEKFWNFHEKNPQVFHELAEMALDAHAKGKKKIGIGMLFEVLRWNRFINTTDADFKLNNNYRSRYSRILVQVYPELDGLFETRRIRS
jgi:hypothetical protein